MDLLPNLSQENCYQKYILKTYESCGSHIYIIVPFWAEFCIRCEGEVHLHSFACSNQLSQNHLVKSLLSPLNDLGVLVDNQWIIDVGLFLYSLFGSIDPYVFMPVWHNHFLFTLGKWFNDVLQQKWAVHLQ